MKAIWKYQLQGPDTTQIEAPAGAEFLSAQVQAGVPCIWALVDPAERKINYTVHIFGTGWDIEDSIRDSSYFLDTFQLGLFVFHVFISYEP